MNAQLHDVYDTSSIFNDITDRKRIIQNYQFSGYLDRDEATKKIVELRQTDSEVAKVTTAGLALRSIPFSQASDGEIVAELQMQIDILTAKFLEITKNELSQM